LIIGANMEKEKEKPLDDNWKSRYQLESNYRPGKDYKYRIAVLINSGCYFFDHVVIIVNTDLKRYRLIIIANKKLVLKRDFISIHGAKLDFYEHFQQRCTIPDIEPCWTGLYYPEKKYFKKMISIESDRKKISKV